MSEFMAALFNTSFVAGACTAVFLLFFSLWGKNYGAGCRKTVWLLIAVCCLLPFRLPVRGYSVAIPEVVIRRGTAEHLQNAAASGDIAAYLAAYLPQGASDRLGMCRRRTGALLYGRSSDLEAENPAAGTGMRGS